MAAGGLITSLMLNEEYVVHVLGFKRSTLNEGRYNMKFQQEIFEAHLLAEGWFSSGVDWLKDKGVKGINAIKDKSYEVGNAIKQYGADIKGVVVGLTAMVNDPEEAKAYKTGIFGSIRTWPKSLGKQLLGMAKWMEDRSMPTFAKALRKIVELIQTLWKKASGAGGWLGGVSMMAVGLAVRYIEEEFGVLEKAKAVKSMLFNPSEIIDDIAGSEAVEEGIEQIQDFFAGKIDEVAEGSDLYKKISGFLKEKLGFLETIKEKFINAAQGIVGGALEQFAGPVAWIKKLVELFQSSSWVVSNLSKMMTKISI